jgi:hypothetical protein
MDANFEDAVHRINLYLMVFHGINTFTHFIALILLLNIGLFVDIVAIALCMWMFTLFMNARRIVRSYLCKQDQKVLDQPPDIW